MHRRPGGATCIPRGIDLRQHHRAGPACGPLGRRLRREPAPSDRPARHHRPVARRQDRVHHGAGARAGARRPLSGFRGDGRRPHRGRAARAAARRCGAAFRLRDPSEGAGRGAALAPVDAPDQRVAADARLSVALRRDAHAHPRHRRLSRRVAARPAAARQKLRAMVGRDAGAVARRAARGARGGLARASCDARSAGAGRRTRCDRGRAPVHRLSARVPRRAHRHEPPAARPVPDAGRHGGLAGADFRAARRPLRWRAAARLAVGDDAPPLPVLLRGRGEAVLPRPLRASRPPDRSGRCARRAQRRA